MVDREPDFYRARRLTGFNTRVTGSTSRDIQPIPRLDENRTLNPAVAHKSPMVSKRLSVDIICKHGRRARVGGGFVSSAGQAP